MTEEIKKKKIVSFSQFSNYWICPHKWMRDYILKEKTFEDNLIMTFGTSIHEAIQLYLKILFEKGDQDANSIDIMDQFMTAFNREIQKKKIPHTPEEFAEFVTDAKNILTEFKDPVNIALHFPRDKWELLGIEDEIKEDIVNNVTLDAKLDIVFREKMTGNIRIVDFKTSTRGWTASNKEDFTKISQLILYKAVYSKRYNIPLNKINIEFYIMKRKTYEKARYVQSRIDVFRPSSYQKDVIEVIQEFRKFVTHCFTPEGTHNPDRKYPKNPGKGKKNCKYCNYLKNGKCDAKAEPIE